MDKIERDFPRIKRVNINDYDKNTSNLVRDDWGRYFLFGHTISTLNLVSRANEILDTNYIYYDNRNPIEITAKDLSKYKHKDFYYKNGANYKILMIGTSQNENLSVFLPYTVQHTKYIRLNNVKNMIYNEQLKVVKNYGDKILQFDPDIIVLTITYDNLPTLADLAVKD